MNNYTKKIFVGLAAAAVFLPVAAFADTNDTQARIQSLLAQIHALQEQVKALVATASSTPPGGGGWTASSTPPGLGGMPPGQVGKMLCITLARDLGVGSRGDDVRKLQDMLAEDHENGFTASSTGVFGPLTARAMMNFQKKNGIVGTGNVGPLTRGLLERRCGKGLGNEGNKGGSATSTARTNNESGNDH